MDDLQGVKFGEISRNLPGEFRLAEGVLRDRLAPLHAELDALLKNAEIDDVRPDYSGSDAQHAADVGYHKLTNGVADNEFFAFLAGVYFYALDAVLNFIEGVEVDFAHGAEALEVILVGEAFIL